MLFFYIRIILTKSLNRSGFMNGSNWFTENLTLLLFIWTWKQS